MTTQSVASLLTPAWDPPAMTDPDKQTIKQRLRQARIGAGFASAPAAARAHGWGISTYGGHENPNGNTPGTIALTKYAKAFGTTVSWLTNGGQNQKQPTRVLPLSGLIGLWGEVDGGPQLNARGRLREIVVPSDIEGAVGAFLIPGPVRYTHYHINTVLVVGAHTDNVSSMVGAEVVCCCGDAKMRFGLLSPGADVGTYDLEIKEGHIIRSVVVQWAAPVILALSANAYQEQTRTRSKGDPLFPACTPVPLDGVPEPGAKGGTKVTPFRQPTQLRA